MKRVFDVVGAVLLGIATSPVLIAAAVAVRMTGSPVLHRAQRAGRGGAPFTLLKFRTMRPGAGPEVTRSGDPRITGVGRLLRRTKVDELPQLWNVLRGDMSLVGPRPEALRFVESYTPEQRRVLDVRPGMTSPTAIAYRHEEALLAELGGDPDRTYAEALLPEKLAMDLAYVRERSLWLDLSVLLRTVGSIFTRPRPSVERRPTT